MFDRNSDHALNKRDENAIVCKSVTGDPVRLTCADFPSEDEFLYWKALSDNDYEQTEKDGRDFDDNNCFSFDERLDGYEVQSSLEDEFISRLEEPERLQARAERSKQIKSALTEKQYRRLCLYHLDGMSEKDIAEQEGVGQPRISNSISSGKRILKKIFEKLFPRRG